MKLPVIIQHHPLGYVVNVPDDEFQEMLAKAKHVDRNKFLDELAKIQGKEMKKEGGKIPERWRKPVKKYSGFVYGVEAVGKLSAEADTEEELLQLLKAKAIEICRGFILKNAKRDWPQMYKITEIEV